MLDSLSYVTPLAAVMNETAPKLAAGALPIQRLTSLFVQRNLFQVLHIIGSAVELCYEEAPHYLEKALTTRICAMKTQFFKCALLALPATRL